MTDLVTIVLPFFNEEGWIGKTLDSLAMQTDSRFRIILVDNASTDGGAEEAMARAPVFEGRMMVVPCPTPGKIHAMAEGVAHVQTPIVAICDADTIYPPDYIANIISLFEGHEHASAVMAIDLYHEPGHHKSLRRLDRVLRKARRFPKKCHAGGYAQAFRTELLRQAGGFDFNRWPYVLEDHEIVYRTEAFGYSVYHRQHICFPSSRRARTKATSWTALERFLHRHTPYRFMGWYFYSFLGPRLARRRCTGTALRHKSWMIGRCDE